jgi:hypothetical protein
MGYCSVGLPFSKGVPMGFMGDIAEDISALV